MVEISLGRIQKTKPYLFADAIEILCAFRNESPFSATDAYSVLLNALAPAEEALDADEDDVDDDNFPDDIDGSQRNARLQEHVDECFRHLEYRMAEFGESYPFHIDHNTVRLKENLTTVHKIYLTLLAASRIRTFSTATGLKQGLANIFEMISLECLRKMLPAAADVISFGPNSIDRNTRLGTNLLDALPQLAELMGVSLTPGWDKDLAPQGDAGIDLVGVQQLDSSQGGWNVFLAQCAAHEEADSWSRKRAEAKLSFYHYLFSYSVESQAVLFIPGCFRQGDGKWAQKRYTDGVILMDRVRLIRLLSESSDVAEQISDFYDQKLQAA